MYIKGINPTKVLVIAELIVSFTIVEQKPESVGKNINAITVPKKNKNHIRYNHSRIFYFIIL